MWRCQRHVARHAVCSVYTNGTSNLSPTALKLWLVNKSHVRQLITVCVYALHINSSSQITRLVQRQWLWNRQEFRIWNRQDGSVSSKLQNRQNGWLVAPSTEYKCMKCKTNNLIFILTLTLTDPVTSYFICPVRNSLAKENDILNKFSYIKLYDNLCVAIQRSLVRGWGAARPRTILVTISSHVHVAEKLLGLSWKVGFGWSIILSKDNT